jgi:hypothetical protein
MDRPGVKPAVQAGQAGQHGGAAPFELFDSMVDRLDQPSIFVLSAGTDRRAYPEYLLRFAKVTAPAAMLAAALPPAPAPAPSPVPVPAGVAWEYEDGQRGSGNWQPFDPTVAGMLEAARAGAGAGASAGAGAGTFQAKLPGGAQLYLFDLRGTSTNPAAMQQTNLQTGFARQIRRV